jgi:glucose-1-phosphate adenylyltransferase
MGYYQNKDAMDSLQNVLQDKLKPIPQDPNHILASMGIYLFKADVLVELLRSVEKNDFGRDIIPSMLESHQVFAYPYARRNHIGEFVYATAKDGRRQLRLDPNTRDSTYWRDVETLDAYWNANMDLTGVAPHFNLYGRKWPIHTYRHLAPPAKFVFATERRKVFRVGKALDSLVAPGCIVSGIVRNCVLSYNIVIGSWSNVGESVILDGVAIGRHSKIKKTIIDKENNIPPHTEIGCDPKEDRKRFAVTSRGIVVVPKGYFKSDVP